VSDNNNHIEPLKSLSPEMMEAYLNNKLNEQDQYRVEKYLLDHPFEAEAMDGFETFPEAIQDIPILEQHLDNRIDQEEEKKAKVVPLWKRALPYAATLIVLITATIIVLNYASEDKEIKPISIKENDEIDLDLFTYELPVKPSKESVNQKADNYTSEQTAKTQPTKTTQTKTLADNKPIKKEIQEQSDLEEIVFEDSDMIAATSNKTEAVFDSPKVAAMKVQVEPIQIDIPAELEIAMADEVKEEEPSLSKSAGMATERSLARKKSSQSKTISGYVTAAETGEALPGVNVLVQGSTAGTNTDLDGYFEIEASPNDILQIAFIGMQTEEVSIGNNSTLNIELETDVQQLSEVVVTAYGEEKEQTEVYISAKPENGKRAFKNYVEENIRLPEEVISGEVSGKVKLQFTVTSRGEITDIKVIKSLSQACNQEAIRLLKNGPKWEPATRNGIPESEVAKVSIKFKN